MSRFTTSAPSRSAASSNDTRVRVLGSKNRLATVCPARLWSRAGRSPGCAHVELREIEQRGQLLGAQAFQRDEVPQAAVGVALHGGAGVMSHGRAL